MSQIFKKWFNFAVLILKEICLLMNIIYSFINRAR